MKKLLVYLSHYKKESVLGPLFKLLEASFELLVPLVMAAVIDKGIAGRDTDYVVRMCLVMVGLGVIGLVCSVTAQYFAARRRWASPQASATRCSPISRVFPTRKWIPWGPPP